MNMNINVNNNNNNSTSTETEIGQVHFQDMDMHVSQTPLQWQAKQNRKNKNDEYCKDDNSRLYDGAETASNNNNINDNMNDNNVKSRIASTAEMTKAEGGDVSQKCCASIVEVVSGVTWGWGFTNKPPERIKYYMTEIMVGTIICFAQIPESVAFAFMANIGPMVALHAAWIIGLFSSVFGGRPGMIHGATGAKAAVIATFVPCNGTENCAFEDHQIEFLYLAVIICGLLNAMFAFFRLSILMQLIPTPVMIGFCNGLAIVIGLAQIHTFQHHGNYVHGWEAFWMVLICFIAMVVMELWPYVPYVGKWIPSTLISILVAVFIEFVIVRLAFGHKTRTIRDVAPNLGAGKFPLPIFLNSNYDMDIINNINWEDVKRIGIMGVRLFIVGTLEELMTVELMNDLHKNKGSGDQQMFGSALGNVVAGFFGTMGGNSMIGLSVISYRSGAKGREVGLVAALAVLTVVAAASQVLKYIPVAALSGVMFIVVIHTFKWFSVPMVASTILPAKIRKCHPQFRRKIKRWDACIIVVVSVLTPITDLLLAVCVGVCLAALVFVWESKRKFRVETYYDTETKTKYYEIDGPLFYGAKTKFLNIFDIKKDPKDVVAILKGNSALFDYSAMEALNKLKKKYSYIGKNLTINGLKDDCIKMVVKANRLVQHVDVTLSEMYVPTVPALYSTETSKAIIDNESRYGCDDNTTLPHNSLENVEVTTHIEANTTPHSAHIRQEKII